MTTFSFNTLSVFTDFHDYEGVTYEDLVYDRGILSLALPFENGDFTYAYADTDAGSTAAVLIADSGLSIVVDDRVVDDSWRFEVGRVDWDGQTSILLFAIKGTSSYGASIAGSDLPAITTQADFDLWTDSITYAGRITSGDYAPGLGIDLGAAPGVSVSEDDLVNATYGDDTVNGGAGSDTVNGGAGADTISGGAGADTLNGGTGGDVVSGDGAGDQISGGSGNDTLDGGTGSDVITGQGGSDRLFGGAGFDLLTGGGGKDRLYGSGGGDTIDGSAGGDFLKGQDGDDVMIGGTGRDALRGGAGADTFVFAAGDGVDRVFDYDPALDKLSFGLALIGDGLLEVSIEAGNTVLRYGLPIDGASVTLIGVEADQADLDITYF